MFRPILLIESDFESQILASSVGRAKICFKRVVMLPEQAYNSGKENRCPRPCCYLFVPIKIPLL